MTYPETIRYLESFINYEKIAAWPYKESLKLKRFKDFLQLIDNPQKSLRCIHVAGSKGKGSTCIFISYILRQAGLRVGLYTSPHLSDFRERIRILDARVKNRPHSDGFEGMISREELTRLTEYLKPIIEKYNKYSKYGELSFFEVYTAAAFTYFRNNKVDFVVLETGLGGRLDATNTVDSLVSVITPISYEHTQKLGNTLKEIALEKAGIIRGHKSIVVSAPQKKEVSEVIRARCKKMRLRLFGVGKDIAYCKHKDNFKVSGILGAYPDLKINLLGEHQLVNSAVAIGAVEALSLQAPVEAASCIKPGLFNACWPGRCEVVAKNPLVVLDGAQNAASCYALKTTVKNNFKYKKLILILGACKDKDIKGICRCFEDFADTVILSKADNPRASDTDQLAVYFKRGNRIETASVKEALDKARAMAKKDDLILVCGSLFVVAEAREQELKKTNQGRKK